MLKFLLILIQAFQSIPCLILCWLPVSPVSSRIVFQLYSSAFFTFYFLYFLTSHLSPDILHPPIICQTFLIFSNFYTYSSLLCLFFTYLSISTFLRYFHLYWLEYLPVHLSVFLFLCPPEFFPSHSNTGKYTRL